MILIVAPWSSFWDRNVFAAALPSMESWLASPYARGGVSGVGVVTLLAGLAELGGAFASRRDGSAPTTPTVHSDR